MPGEHDITTRPSYEVARDGRFNVYGRLHKSELAAEFQMLGLDGEEVEEAGVVGYVRND
jgi:hypothetical protein